jgi:hypothetical protein
MGVCDIKRWQEATADDERLFSTTVQTFGDLAHWHPHVHTIVTDGLFAEDGTFLPLPKLQVEPFLKLWEQRLFALLVKRGKITPAIFGGNRDGGPRLVLCRTGMRISSSTRSMFRSTNFSPIPISQCHHLFHRLHLTTPFPPHAGVSCYLCKNKGLLPIPPVSRSIITH